MRDLEAGKPFYVGQLALPVLQETPAMNLLAIGVGNLRMPIFANRIDDDGPGPSQIILAVDNVAEAIAELEARGVALSGPPSTAGTLLRCVTAIDPAGNVIAISAYLRNAIQPI